MGRILGIVVPQRQSKSVESMIPAVMLVLFFHEDIFLGAFVITKRDDANRSVFVPFCNNVISAAI